MSATNLFTADFKPAPYWWQAAPPDQNSAPALPGDVDIAVIGAGYTGLQAALQTARAGLSTLVLDGGAPGHGASTRNGGQISTSLKPGFEALSRRYGAALATDLLREGQASLDYLADFVAEEKIDCDFNRCGRFVGAHSPKHFQALARSCEGPPAPGTDAYAVPRSDQNSEMGTAFYHGGIVLPRHASLHPAKYHRGLLARVRAAGALVSGHCPALSIERGRDRFTIATPEATITAHKVIVATNGYTGRVLPWHRRRVIPIGSYIIATEPLQPDLMTRLMPRQRVISDTRRLVFYYRPSPDGRRILFGGRVSVSETDPVRTAPLLHREMVRIFPELAQTRIAFSWAGFVAYTFDTMMHAGEEDGLYYAMGYCGSGVGMSSYLGMHIGQQAAGVTREPTAFSRIPFPTRPFYSGTPWFLAPSVLAYKALDRLGW